MRRILLCAAATLALGIASLQTASAADISAPVYKAPPAAAPLSWTGFYIGGYAGYGWGRSEHDFTTGVGPTGAWDINGGVAGGTVGWNMQSGTWLFGLEGDFGWADIKGNFAGLGCISGNCYTTIESLGTARGRVGAIVANNLLAYVTGGWAWGRVNAGVLNSTDAATKWRDGWTLGGGFEYMFTKNLSGKIEYLYVDLGNDTHYTTAGGIPTRARVDTSIVRGGLNLHFGAM